jgi:predicted membrane channel-forming protein YqfA (hemolysin III family)
MIDMNRIRKIISACWHKSNAADYVELIIYMFMLSEGITHLLSNPMNTRPEGITSQEQVLEASTIIDITHWIAIILSLVGLVLIFEKAPLRRLRYRAYVMMSMFAILMFRAIYYFMVHPNIPFIYLSSISLGLMAAVVYIDHMVRRRALDE